MTLGVIKKQTVTSILLLGLQTLIDLPPMDVGLIRRFLRPAAAHRVDQASLPVGIPITVGARANCINQLPLTFHGFPVSLKMLVTTRHLWEKTICLPKKPQDGSPGQPPAFDLVSGRKVPGNRGGHVDWVKTARERPVNKPFFFWFASHDAHRSWDGDKDWNKERYGPRHRHQDGTVPAFLVDDEATREDLASYRNEVTRFDSFIGEVVNELQRQNVLSNTLLVIMADNGRPFPRAKTRLHDSGMKTPFIVHWPKGAEKTGRINSESHQCD